MFKLCNNDPLVNVLRSHFNASIARIPKSSIKPCLVLGLVDGKLNTLGKLEDLFTDGLSELPEIKVEQISNELSGKKSGEMSAGFGLKVLEGFLKAFKVPSAGLNAGLNKAKNISYSFDRIRSQYIEALRLGKIVGEQELDISNVNLKPFMKDPNKRLFVVLRTYQSKSFNMHFDGDFQSNLDANVEGLNKLINVESSAQVSVNKKSEGGISFEGNEYKTFAFQLVELEIDDEELYIKAVTPDNNHKVLEESTGVAVSLIDEDPVMFDVVFDDSPITI